MADKKWYTSKTFWGIIISFICAMAARLGAYVDVDAESLAQELIDAALAAGQVFGTVYAIYGRVVASTKLTK